MWVLIPLIATFGWVIGLWYTYLKIPLEITITETHSIEFRAPLKRTVISPHDIQLITSSYLSRGFVTIKHTKGKLRLINHIDGFYDLIYRVKLINPTIEVKGC